MQIHLFFKYKTDCSQLLHDIHYLVDEQESNNQFAGLNIFTPVRFHHIEDVWHYLFNRRHQISMAWHTLNGAIDDFQGCK